MVSVDYNPTLDSRTPSFFAKAYEKDDVITTHLLIAAQWLKSQIKSSAITIRKGPHLVCPLNQFQAFLD